MSSSSMRVCTCSVRLEIRDDAIDAGMLMVDVICEIEQAGNRADLDFLDESHFILDDDATLVVVV